MEELADSHRIRHGVPAGTGTFVHQDSFRRSAIYRSARFGPTAESHLADRGSAT